MTRRQLRHLAHDGRPRLRPREVELTDAPVDGAREPLLEIGHDRRILMPARELARLAIRAEDRHDAIGRRLVEAHRPVVGRARDEGPPHTGLVQEEEHGRGGVVLPAVLAVVEVGVDDGKLVGRRATGHREQRRRNHHASHA